MCAALAGADSALDCEGLAEGSLHATPDTSVLEAQRPFLAASVKRLEAEHEHEHEPGAPLKLALLLPGVYVGQVQCVVTVTQQADHAAPCGAGHSGAYPIEVSDAGRVTRQIPEHTHVALERAHAAQEPGCMVCQAATAVAGAQKQGQQIAQPGEGQPSLAQPDYGELLVLQSHAYLAAGMQRGAGGSFAQVCQLPEQQ